MIEARDIIFNAIAEHGIQNEFNRGKFLYREESPSQHIYAIKSGLVGLYKVTSEGKEILLRVFGNKFFFGHRSFLAGEVHHASALILNRSEIYQISADKFLSILEKNKLYLFVMQVLSKELRVCENRFVNMQEKDTLQRVAHTLVFLKCRDPEHHWSRKEIADYCGLTMESVIRSLSRLEKDGFLFKEGRNLKLSMSQEHLCKYGITIKNS